MKSHFLKLFDYDRYANHIILDAIVKARNPAKAVQLMNHLLTAQLIWHSRCAGLPPVAGTLWGVDTYEPLSAQKIDDNYQLWVGYLETLNAADFDKILAYKNLKGEDFDNKIIDIIAHVINHGTHHRAQIGQQLKQAGIENLPNTDFIAFVRAQ